MIQLHYLGGSSEITPFGNETVRTCGSEEAAWSPSPSHSDTSPGPPVGGAALPPAPRLAEDGESHVPNSLRSPRSGKDAGLVLCLRWHRTLLVCKECCLFWDGSLPPGRAVVHPGPWFIGIIRNREEIHAESTALPVSAGWLRGLE